MSEPVIDEIGIAIVGAPNKGKSSLVSALANEDRIEINPTSGTTVYSREYTITNESGEELISIWDTSGFENARRMREILEDWGINDPNTNNFKLIKKFYDEYLNDEDFRNEIQILKPLLNKVGIVYVVDGSLPYNSAQYDNEIEIIKYTNLPRIAVINPIELDESNFENWTKELEKHFNIVKTFDPYKATFEEKINLFNAFSHINPANPQWEKSFNLLVDYLEDERAKNFKKIASVISEQLIEIFNTTYSIHYDYELEEDENKEKLLRNVTQDISTKVKYAQNKIVRIFGFKNVDIQTPEDFKNEDIYQDISLEKYLSPHQRAIIYAIVGASGGLAIDLTLVGGSFGIPTAIGGGGGYAWGYFSDFNKMDIISSTKKTGDKLEVKKLNNKLFFIVLNQLRETVLKVSRRSAPDRQDIVISYDFDKTRTKKIHEFYDKIVQNNITPKLSTSLNELILERLQQDQKEVVYEEKL